MLVRRCAPSMLTSCQTLPAATGSIDRAASGGSHRGGGLGSRTGVPPLDEVAYPSTAFARVVRARCGGRRRSRVRARAGSRPGREPCEAFPVAWQTLPVPWRTLPVGWSACSRRLLMSIRAGTRHNPADAPLLAPAIGRISTLLGRAPKAVTADRGYGEATVEQDLNDLGVTTVVIPRTGKPSQARRATEHSRPFRRLVKWRTGSEGRISYLSAATASTARCSTAWTAPAPGAGSGCSPTTPSRSPRWTRPRRPPAAQHRPPRTVRCPAGRRTDRPAPHGPPGHRVARQRHPPCAEQPFPLRRC